MHDLEWVKNVGVTTFVKLTTMCVGGDDQHFTEHFTFFHVDSIAETVFIVKSELAQMCDKYTMPRLSLYRQEKTQDYKFIDRNVAETLVVGGTDLYVHKYIGVATSGASNDFTQPEYSTESPSNIQDLLFLENRDRKYDTDIIRLRGHYNVQNHDFDLSQFGLFLNSDIIFIVVHFNTMIELVGRKLMVGDVIELPHLLDEYPLDTTIKYSIKRYYQVTDAAWASEGYSLTWYSHLWRIKCEPLTDSQEFSQILDEPQEKDNYTGGWSSTQTYPPGYTMTYGGVNYLSLKEVPAGITPPNPEYWQEDTNATLRDIAGRYAQNIKINDAIINEAKRLLPSSGYDVGDLYVVPTYDEVGTPGSTANIGNDGIHHPAPPSDTMTASGQATTAYGTVALIRNPRYKNSSPVIRVPRDAVASIWDMTVDSASAIDKFVQLSLETVDVSPAAIGNGSRSVEREYAISAYATGPVTGPYGTTDNTYSTGDQRVSVVVTANTTNALATVIRLIAAPTSDMVGLLIRGTVTSFNGSKIPIFPTNTRIVGVDVDNKLITVGSSIVSSVPAGTAMQVAYDFTGVVAPEMDYRADCDPRFYYITRSSPRGFGYLQGYLTGDGTAPNGLPTGSGIAFPSSPKVGDYFLRIDYLPQVLFRWDGNRWVRISENVRTGSGVDGNDKSQKSEFINNSNVTVLTNGTTTTEKQALSTVLRIKPDNLPPQ